MSPEEQMKTSQGQQKIDIENQDLALRRGQDIDKMAENMKNDLDANKGRAGNFGDIAARHQAGERMNTLIGSFKNGNLPPQQMEELGLGMANMISGSSGASRSQVEAIVPSSIMGDSKKLTQWLSNNPTGANQQAFVEMMGHTINREMDTARQQIGTIIDQRLPSNARLKRLSPDLYNNILGSALKGYGIDPNNPNGATSNQTSTPPTQQGQQTQNNIHPDLAPLVKSGDRASLLKMKAQLEQAAKKQGGSNGG